MSKQPQRENRQQQQRNSKQRRVETLRGIKEAADDVYMIKRDPQRNLYIMISKRIRGDRDDYREIYRVRISTRTGNSEKPFKVLLDISSTRIQDMIEVLKIIQDAFDALEIPTQRKIQREPLQLL